MSRLKLVPLAIFCTAALVAPRAFSEGRRAPGSIGSMDGGTDFDAYTRDHLERHEPRGRKPAGWVGPWPPRSQEASAPEGAPGGGDMPPQTAEQAVIYTDVALPPPDLEPEPAPPLPAETEGAEHALPSAPPVAKGKTRVNTKAPDLERASYEVTRSRVAQPSDIRGRFTWSSATEKEPVPLYTRAGFVTLVELKNGERPSGGAFCGSCARVLDDGQVSEEGAFIVEAMADKVSIRPRDTSGPEGLLATNLHIVTDAGRTLTFDVIEVTGTGLQPTARHEIRGSRDEGSTILDYSFPARVDQASKLMEERLRRDLAEREDDLLAEKAARRMNSYTDVKVERKAGGRKLVIEAATTLGDETVIRMRVEAGQGDVADPVALLQAGGRARILKTRSILRQPESSSLVITLSVEGVVLGDDQRIAVSMLDRRSGEELRSSVGRG